jgi:hypothetical protein
MESKWFISVFTWARHWSLSWSMHPVQTFQTYFLKILFNIIVLTTPRSSEWSLSFRFFRPKFCIRFSSSQCALHAPPISFSFLVFCESLYAAHLNATTTPLFTCWYSASMEPGHFLLRRIAHFLREIWRFYCNDKEMERSLDAHRWVHLQNVLGFCFA